MFCFGKLMDNNENIYRYSIFAYQGKITLVGRY